MRNNPSYLTALTGAEIMWNGNATASRRYQTEIPPEGSLEHKMLKEFEQRLIHHKESYFSAEEFFYVPQMEAEWSITAADGSSQTALGVTVILRRRHTAEGLFPDAEVGDEVTARRVIHSDRARSAWLHVGFGAPYRSHRKWQGIPEQGQWDAFDAEVTLNGKPVAPPKWQQPGKFKQLGTTWHQPIQEEPWREEALYWLRQPVRVKLQAGENHFALRSQYGYPQQHWQVSLWLTDDNGEVL